MSLATILTDIDTFVKSEVSAGETAIENWWTKIEPIAEADFQNFVNAMKPIALALVTGLAESAISGPAKLATATTALLSVAKTQGITATTTMANTLLQQIVASLAMTPAPASK